MPFQLNRASPSILPLFGRWRVERRRDGDAHSMVRPFLRRVVCLALYDQRVKLQMWKDATFLPSTSRPKDVGTARCLCINTAWAGLA